MDRGGAFGRIYSSKRYLTKGMNLTVMKAYLYFILVFLSDSLAFFNVYGRVDNSFDLLRILYLEKTSFKDFSFKNPYLHSVAITNG